MKYLIKSLSILALFLLVQSQALADNRKSFSGSVVVEWLNGGDDRKMKLLEELSYTDPKGKVWKVPKGAIIDGASIPKAFWSFVGPPFVGAYRRASVVHDYYCDKKSDTWEAVHRMFFDASLDGGVSVSKAVTMYAAVYAGGPRWKTVKMLGSSPLDEPIKIPLDPILPEEDLEEVMKWTENKNVSIDDVEKHIKSLANK
ncbi:MAG: DUF1353 domain-containing protein [Candidatus Thiodiazotropha taylori]